MGKLVFCLELEETGSIELTAIEAGIPIKMDLQV